MVLQEPQKLLDLSGLTQLLSHVDTDADLDDFDDNDDDDDAGGGADQPQAADGADDDDWTSL